MFVLAIAMFPVNVGSPAAGILNECEQDFTYVTTVVFYSERNPQVNKIAVACLFYRPPSPGTA